MNVGVNDMRYALASKIRMRYPASFTIFNMKKSSAGRVIEWAQSWAVPLCCSRQLPPRADGYISLKTFHGSQTTPFQEVGGQDWASCHGYWNPDDGNMAAVSRETGKRWIMVKSIRLPWRSEGLIWRVGGPRGWGWRGRALRYWMATHCQTAMRSENCEWQNLGAVNSFEGKKGEGVNFKLISKNQTNNLIGVATNILFYFVKYMIFMTWNAV